MRRKKTNRKTVSSYNRYRRKSSRIIKVKVNGTLNDVSKLQIIDSIDFENLTGKFWIKTSGNYNSKVEFKQMELNFN